MNKEPFLPCADQSVPVSHLDDQAAILVEESEPHQSKNRNQAPLFPIRARPFDDEITSSWLVRVAHGLGLNAGTLAVAVAGHSNGWIADPDVDPASPLIQKIGAKTGVPPLRIFGTSLDSFAGSLFERIKQKRTRWILHRGIGNAVPYFGMQYCPRCLEEDEEPYFRKWWRLSLAVSCPKHRVFLVDRCGACNSPVRYHQSTPARGHDPGSGIVRCYKCGFDMRKAVSPSLVGDAQLHQYQAVHYDMVSRGSMDVQGFGPLANCFLYFDILRVLRNQLREDRFADLANLIRRSIGLPANDGEQRTELFDRLPHQNRRELLYMASWVLDQWLTRYTSFCQEDGITSLQFPSRTELRPEFFCETLLDSISVGPSIFKVKTIAKTPTGGYRGFCGKMEFLRSKRDQWADPRSLARELKAQGHYRKAQIGAAETLVKRLIALAGSFQDDRRAYLEFYNGKATPALRAVVHVGRLLGQN
jgi:hypothetical protein